MRFQGVVAVAMAATGIAASAARADVGTFYFAQVGQSYSAFLPSDDPLIGQEIILARIYLDVDIFPGSDAANFFTDISFPIEPLPGGESALVLTGADLGWSGAGTFHYFLETTAYNGTFISRRFGAETPGMDFDGEILNGSRIEFITVPAPSALAMLGAAGLAFTARRRA